MRNRLFLFSVLTNLALLAVVISFVYTFGGPRYFWFRLTHSGADGLSESRNSAFAAVPPTEDAIVMLGDSLIQNCEWHELLQDPRVLNRGISGQWSDVLLKRMGHVTALKPAQVFVMTGINDLRARTPDEITSTLTKIVQRIKDESPSTKIFVHSILPVNNEIHNTGRTNEDILSLNTKLSAMCSDSGCRFVDVHSLYADENGRLKAEYTFDGVHIKGTAYKEWAKALKPLL